MNIAFDFIFEDSFNDNNINNKSNNITSSQLKEFFEKNKNNSLYDSFSSEIIVREVKNEDDNNEINNNQNMINNTSIPSKNTELKGKTKGMTGSKFTFQKESLHRNNLSSQLIKENNN
jgi:hypothetical protein